MSQLIVTAHGARIPAIGLGTWSLKGEEGARAVEAAIRAGYRHIDGAIMYENETEVGQGIRAAGVARSELFITTKVPPALIGEKDLIGATEGSLRRFGIDQADLLLIHWPNAEIDLGGTIRALCKAKTSGLARHIGLSNFTLPLLDKAWALTTEPLADLQCENHPLMDQSRLIAAARARGMAFTSYTPIGRGKLFGAAPIVAAAAAHGRTESQIILRWHVQQGLVAIPRSVNPQRIAENLNVFDFALSAAEMAAITGMARPDGRMVRPAFAPEWDD